MNSCLTSGQAEVKKSMSNSILKLPAEKNKTGLARSTIYLRIKQCSFPKQISLGGRTDGWVERNKKGVRSLILKII